MEINWQKNCALADRPKTPLLKLMAPSVSLLARDIVPMRNMRDRCTVNSDRWNDRQLVTIIPVPPPLNT
jgi:hypothetical protein